MRIGVQGAAGSFSEAAAQSFVAKHQLPTAELCYLITAERVLKALDQGDVDYAVIAIANNRGGVVWEAVTALAPYRCHIQDRLGLLIQQNLLVLPGLALDQITEVHSHIQALSQCRDFLFYKLRQAKVVEADDTAESAKRLANGILPKTAAVIARSECAELYGLQLLSKNIQDLTHNETSFLWLKRL
jgi:prephenate dehydratase